MDDLKRRMGIDAGFHADWIDELARGEQQLESAQLSDRLVQRTLDRLSRELPEARPSWWAWLAGQLGLRRSGLVVMVVSSLCAFVSLGGAGVMYVKQAAAHEHTTQQIAELNNALQATRAELANSKRPVVAAWAVSPKFGFFDVQLRALDDVMLEKLGLMTPPVVVAPPAPPAHP